MKIAIDGPAGVGKSTVARLLSEKFNLTYINTGAMYRAVAYLKLKNPNISVEDLNMEFIGDDLFVNGKNLSDKIFNENIDKLSSKISQEKKVRNVLTRFQREMIDKYDRIVMEGRDIGTVVMPDADFKFFLTASAEVRAKRRLEQDRKKGKILNFEAVKKALKKRDKEDITRTNSPLKKADDAIEIDTTNMSINEVINKISYYIRRQK